MGFWVGSLPWSRSVVTGSEADYARDLKCLADDKVDLVRLEVTLGEAGLTREERERVLQAVFVFHTQLREEVEEYESVPSVAVTVSDEIREGRCQLTSDEASVELWLATFHPALDGDVPRVLMDAGETELVLAPVQNMLAGGHA